MYRFLAVLDCQVRDKAVQGKRKEGTRGRREKERDKEELTVGSSMTRNLGE